MSHLNLKAPNLKASYHDGESKGDECPTKITQGESFIYHVAGITI